MQLKHSFFIIWSCYIVFCHYVQARVANHQGPLAERSLAEVKKDGSSGLFGKVQNFVLGKRQEICVYDAYLQALDDLSLAMDLCGQIIGLPSATVVIDSTPVM